MHLALLGTLSLLQVVFLPGFLVLRALRLGTGIVAGAVLSFALSLLANYYLVAALVALHVYRPAVIYLIFAAEVGFWLRLDAWRLAKRLAEAAAAARAKTRSFFAEIERASPIRSQTLGRALIAAATVLIALFALAGLAEAGRIFEQWDAVVSWNRWAIDWSANHLPNVTSYYPQLLPANVSLTYVFMRTSEVWIFAKGVQFLFCTMLLAAMLDAARQRGNFGLVPGVIITYALLVALLRYRMLSSGYADVPLAFFAWMPVYVLILARRAANRGQHFRYLLLGALLAAGAALTKQTGLYVAALYPLLAWRLSPSLPSVSSPDRFRAYAALCLLLAALVAPWYAYKYFDIEADHDANNTAQLVSDFHEGRSLPDRMTHAGAAVLDALTVPGGVLLLISLAASLPERRARWLLGLFVVPLGLLWAAGFSYDLRNLALLAPFLGAAAGEGLVRIVAWADRSMGRRKRNARVSDFILPSPAPPRAPSFFSAARIAHVAVPLVVLLLATTFTVSDRAIVNLQRREQRRVGIVSLNAWLYAFAAKHNPEDLIATDYLAMRWLPDLAPRSVVCMSHKLSAFRRTYNLPNVRYVLVRPGAVAADVRAFLDRPGAVRLLFRDHGFAFYEKLAPRA